MTRSLFLLREQKYFAKFIASIYLANNAGLHEVRVLATACDQLFSVMVWKQGSI